MATSANPAVKPPSACADTTANRPAAVTALPACADTTVKGPMADAAVTKRAAA